MDRTGGASVAAATAAGGMVMMETFIRAMSAGQCALA